MTRQQMLPTLLIFIDLAAAVGYWGDWRKMGYWTAAGILTFCVTY